MKEQKEDENGGGKAEGNREVKAGEHAGAGTPLSTGGWRRTEN